MLTSFLALFFELLCIRWIPSYVRYLSFFTNFILLASFLGIGVGILSARRQRLLLPPFPWLALLLAAVVALNRFELRINSTQVLYYGVGEGGASAENYLVLPLIFLLVAVAFICLTRPLGVLLVQLPPLKAYALDILGSLAGIAAFFVVSLLELPPVAWFGLLALALLPLLNRRGLLVSLLPLGGLVALAAVLGLGSSWSPYYRVQVYPAEEGGYIVDVNNSGGFQSMIPSQKKEVFYARVYELFPQRRFQRALIIGAGSGSDTAIALQHGVGHVDAVEIDPVILRLGEQLHPEQPYADPRVALHVEDGRAFLRNTDQTYDLIVFALPDSLTLTSSFSSLRLESFLFTDQSFAAVAQHLAPDGIVVLYNYYREDWLVAKLAGMLERAFGRSPYVTTYGGWGKAAVLVSGPGMDQLPAALQRPFQAEQASSRGDQLPLLGAGLYSATAPPAATDDWPFLYLPQPTLPWVYVGSLALIAGLALVLLRVAAPLQALARFDWHFFFLGAAFMLLETRSLVGFALLFGSTWMVNSLVFFAILTSVLLAIAFNARVRVRRIGLFYVGLFGALALNYLLPPEALLFESPMLRYGLASLLAFSPIFLANVVFSHSFRDTHAADLAFASNLLGVMVGGMLEYLSLALGYRHLLLLAIAFYVAALALYRHALAK
ncbi:MAG: spermidine synthase [Chloroflexi bacterium]|nr:spermidine synthase [Chloroflexota bacterium]